jgi:hypothetical protein
MILGLHSFDKLIQVYGEENARNLSSLARTKLILAAADLDTAEQCARYIGNREIRQMDEGYSYGYNNTRDASTLTPRKQVEPLVIPDDITNLPAMHGFVKFPDGFPAARIRLEWADYPKVAEGFIVRKPGKPGDPEAVVRGGGGKLQGSGEDGGRGESLAMTEEEVEPANEANNQAANILAQPTEGEVDNSRDGQAIEATARTDIQPRSDSAADRNADDERDDRARAMTGHSVTGKVTEMDKEAPTPTGERPEDLSVREARDAFPDEAEVGL